MDETGAQHVRIMYKDEGPDRSWPPVLETYCPTCRRMVEARRLDSGVLTPARHFRFSMDSMDRQNTRLCRPGAFFTGLFTHGQEDPRAAFRYIPEDQPTHSDIISATNTDAVVVVIENITRGDN
jgi:hypothetical protein